MMDEISTMMIVVSVLLAQVAGFAGVFHNNERTWEFAGCKFGPLNLGY